MDFRVKKIEIVTIILILTGLLHSKLNAQAPIASFNSTTPNGCAPLTLTFTNTSVSSNSWHWNFGNGNTSTLKNPTAVYVNSGLYTVTLVAINTLTGLRDTFTQVNYVNVAAVPNPMFTVSPSVACSNNALISFTNVSSGATAYTWDFGDGTSSNAVIPIHNYSSAGNYTVKLIAKNSANCSSIYILNNAVNLILNLKRSLQLIQLLLVTVILFSVSIVLLLQFHLVCGILVMAQLHPVSLQINHTEVQEHLLFHSLL